MKTLEKIKQVISDTMLLICAVLVAACTLLAAAAVILRYFFNIVFIQTEELITFLFIAIVFPGIVPVIQRKEHVAVALIQNMMSGYARKALIIFQYAVIIVVQVVFLYASYYWIRTNSNFLTPGLRIPYQTIYMLVPVSSFLSGVIAVIDLIETILTPVGDPIFRKEAKPE